MVRNPLEVQAAQDPKTILLVEDDLLIALMEQTLLEKEGYRVLLAATGEKAVDLVIQKHEPVDLILMDINLGSGMDGTQAAQEILRAQEIPIIFLSSHTDSETVEKTEKITSYGYVAKNCGATVLNASIKMAFRLFSANQKIKQTSAEYRILVDNSLDGIALHEVVVDEQGNPVDYIFLQVNPAFEKHTGLRASQVVNQRATRVFPGIEKSGLIEKYGSVALTGAPVTFETYIESMQSWFSVSAYPAGPRRFAAVFENISERKQAEARLRESQERVQRIINNSNAGYFRISRAGLFEEVNRAWLNVHGFDTADEAVGLHFSQTQVDQDLAKAQENVRSVLDGGEITSGEFTRRRKDQSTGYHMFTLAPVFQNGAISGLEGFLIDTTQRKLAEKALRENEERFKALFERAPLGYQSLDSSGNFIEVNQAWLDLLGYSRDEVIGRWFGDFLLPETVDAFRQRFPLFKANGKIQSEFPMRCKDGSLHTIAFEGRIGYHPDGSFRQTHCILSDITTQKLADTERERLKKIRQAIIDKSHTHLVYLDPQFNFVAVNAVYARTCQLKPEELIGKNHFALFPHAENEAIFRRVVETGEPVSYHDKVFIFQDQPGRGVSYWDWTLTPVRDSAGAVEGLVFSLVETTERKLAEEKILQLLQEKELLLKEVHHRIKNNMNTIYNLLLMQMQTLAENSARVVLQDAASRVQAMMTLYDRLNLAENVRSVSLRDYLVPLIDEIINIFPNKETVRVETDIAAVPLGERLLSPIGLILNELITNAMKYAFPGRVDGLIQVNVAQRGEQLCLIFADNGVGLPPAVTLADPPGFGLRIVSILVQQLNATVTVEREQGTRYQIVMGLG